MEEQVAEELAHRIWEEDTDILTSRALRVGSGYEVEVTFLSELNLDDVPLRRVSRLDAYPPRGTVRIWGYYIQCPGDWDLIRTLKSIPIEEAIELEDTEDAVVRYFENMPKLMLEPCLYSKDVQEALEKRGYSRAAVKKEVERLAQEGVFYRAARGKYCLEAA